MLLQPSFGHHEREWINGTWFAKLKVVVDESSNDLTMFYYYYYYYYY
jgi:hypothetical protein